MGKLTMDEFVAKFTNLIWYVTYIKEEKAKIQWFLNYLHTSYKERIEFDHPKSMDEAIRKARLCYQQFKNRKEGGNSWKNKDRSKEGGNLP